MAWQDAPVLNKLTASQQGGNRGAQLWGVDYKGKLYTIYQVTPGGEWSQWIGPEWAGPNYPKQVYELAASQIKEGCTQFWALDMKHQLWSTWQSSPGGAWTPWKQNWNPVTGGFKFKKIAATQGGGGRSAYLFGIAENGILISCNQNLPAGNWGEWSDFRPTSMENKAQWIEVTACTQGDGKCVLWALDTKRQLWGVVQESPGGTWGEWVGPNWQDAPKLANIAAVETTVKRDNENIHGACIWGITDDYKLVYNEQSRPAANWFGWTVGGFKDTLRGFEITAARQNNQSARTWVISNEKQVLVSQQVDINSSPPGWERFWTPDV